MKNVIDQQDTSIRWTLCIGFKDLEFPDDKDLPSHTLTQVRPYTAKEYAVERLSQHLQAQD